jgi:glutathione synthase/RimK-type ligase-like ATP-grasp enzyme
MVASWTWDPAAASHLAAVCRTIRASTSVLLTDGLRDPEGLGSDKLAMYHFAGTRGVPVLPTVSVPFGRYARGALSLVGEWVVADGYLVKPREMAMGFGVLKVDTMEQLTATIDLLAPSGLGCLVQPFQANSGDLRVYVHRGEVIAALLRKPAPGGYLANLSQGATGSAMSVPSDVAELSLRLAHDLASPYLCIDWLLTDAGPVFNEWMTVSAAFEDLPEPERSRVADAMFAEIADQLADSGS